MKFSEKELQLIDVVEKLFAEKGYEGTSVRDIAKEACGNVSMVSYYFGSKENLLAAIFERRSEEIKSHISHLLDNDDLTDLQKVNIFIDEFLSNVIAHKNLHKVLIREELFNRDSDTHALIYEFKKRNLAMITGIIQHGIDNGSFRKDVNMALLMATLVGTTSQLFVSQDFYAEIAGILPTEKDNFNKTLSKKLGDHIKGIFKVVLTGEL